MLDASESATAPRPPARDHRVAAPAPLASVRIRLRRAIDDDAPYVLDSWRMAWRLADRNRSMRGADYARKFDALVRNGVMAQRDTEYIVGCNPDDVGEIWSWCCYTPGHGAVCPTIHFAVTKRSAPSLPNPRGLGFLARILATAGVRDALVYTFKPAERAHKSRRDPLHVEAGLLGAAKRAGIRATYHSVEDFLALRGVR